MVDIALAGRGSEAGQSLIKVLDEIESYLGADRTVFVAREMTKKFEELSTGTPAEIKATYENRTVKGECVVIIQPSP